MDQNKFLKQMQELVEFGRTKDNVLTKEEIQLHGYRNEMVDGKRLKIPQRVREFVDLWEREVLAEWQLPPEKTAPKKKSRFAAAASVA